MHPRGLPILVAALLCAAGPVLSRAQQPPDGVGREEARRKYPPDLTRALLQGKIPAPAEFEAAVKQSLGADRLARLRSGAEEVSGRDNDVAALCLLRLGVPAETLRRPRVRTVSSSYPAAEGKTSGSFRTGQDADILLSGIDFDETGGPLLFNHPMGITTDGTRLLLADTYNNRVLIWNRLPDGNTPPDVVLGQKDFHANRSGDGKDQMDWPVAVAVGGGKLAVADTENQRILIWNRIPTANAAPADLVLRGEGRRHVNIVVTKSSFHWPWGVWTDGEKMAVTSTGGGGVLIWNRFPAQDDQPADVVLRGGGKLGTPRSITSDGKSLIVGDHNPNVGRPGGGTFFWKTFPTADDQPFDFFREDPKERGGPWLRGCFAPDGRLWLLGSTLYAWDAVPRDAQEPPALAIRGYDFAPGDHTGVAAAGGRLYVCTGNLNMIVAYRTVPTRPDQAPDFAIGSPDVRTNTLETNFIVSNPVPASNGRSLFVTSEFDRRLYVWKRLPDRSGAHPDLVYDLPAGPGAIAVRGSTLALAGHRTVFLWRTLPLDGRSPDAVFEQGIGSIRFQDLGGVALDDEHFYLADSDANRIYVWDGMPSDSSEPAFALDVKMPAKISSDGEYLAVGTTFRHIALLYTVKDLCADSRPGVVGSEPGQGAQGVAREQMFNGSSSVLTWKGSLFVADTGFNRVHVWRDLRDAVAGKRPDVLLGKEDWEDRRAETGRNRLHWPHAISFDGNYLWVGEVKFSERLLRFSPRP